MPDPNEFSIEVEVPTNIIPDGTYIIVNAKAGTYVDQSGEDGRSIICWPGHRQSNQQWRLRDVGYGLCTLQSVSSGKYISFIEDSEPENGVRLFASLEEQRWRIERDEKVPHAFRYAFEGYCIIWMQSDVDLL